jgi:ParB/RepB/Spo0J family partition protein
MMASKNPRKDKEVKRRDLYSTDELEKIHIVAGLNARRGEELPDIPELMDLIRASNRVTPLLVRRNPDPTNPALWDLIGGHRRLEAAKRLMAEGMEIKVSLEEITCTDAEMVLYMAMDNMGNVDFSPIEEADVVVRLERMGWSDDEICKRMGRSLPWVKERRQMYLADDSIKDEVRDGLAADVGADIAAAGTEEQQRTIFEEAKAEAQKEAGKKGRKGDWRRHMRGPVAKRTGRKLVPGKKALRALKQEIEDAAKAEVLNGESKAAMLALDVALGDLSLDDFRDQMGYVLEDAEA